MEKASLDFPHNARMTYTAIKRLFEMKDTKFDGVDCDDDLFVVTGRRGWLLSPFSERVKMKVVATSSQTCKVIIESSSRSFLNLLNFGVNKGNVSDLSDYINNEVYRLIQTGEIPMSKREDHSEIKMSPPDLRFK